jgi:hypothetical protein
MRNTLGGQGGDVHFDLQVTIDRSPSEVFAFLRDKDLHPQDADSPVLALDKTSPGPPGVGTRYREVVQMMPLVRATIFSEITRFEPPQYLEEDFWGGAMRGHLAYEFVARGSGTVLMQRETVEAAGLLRAIAPMLWRRLGPRLRERLEGIKQELEAGWPVQPER